MPNSDDWNIGKVGYRIVCHEKTLISTRYYRYPLLKIDEHKYHYLDTISKSIGTCAFVPLLYDLGSYDSTALSC